MTEWGGCLGLKYWLEDGCNYYSVLYSSQIQFLCQKHQGLWDKSYLSSFKPSVSQFTPSFDKHASLNFWKKKKKKKKTFLKV